MTLEPFPVRLSHLLRDCSVGAVVREKDRLVVVKDTRSWYSGALPPQDAELRYVDQVRSTLGISERLCVPPAATLGDSGAVTNGIPVPVIRFPKWTRCPRCGLLQNRPWKGKPAGERLRCEGRGNQGCGATLEQVPWVIVHKDGYLADVPWHEVAHSDRRSQRPDEDCARDWDRPYLRLVDRSRGVSVQCTRCKALRKLPVRWAFPPYQWQQPWMPEPPATLPDEHAWLVGINDVRLHAPKTLSALVIPPESRVRRGTVVDRLYTNSERQRALRSARPGLQRKALLRKMAREWRCSVEDVEEALEQIDRGYPLYGHDPAQGDLFRAEYRALTEPIPDVFEEEDFVTNHLSEEWKALGARLSGNSRAAVSAVSRLIQVKRLREVLALQGFKRLHDGEVVPPDITGETGWLPALGLRGEGVFLTLDEDLLRSWSRQDGLQRRVATMAGLCQSVPAGQLLEDSEISPRFVLLHTLAHLLIRQFETEAGYPAASIRERIYCADGAEPMAGILVYVAVPDDIGSLGGLVELAEPRQFLRVLAAALDAACWCSLDPLCSEHEGQGPGLLNRAACQACALVPEPSCQFRNALLDRTFLKGNAGDGVASLLECAGGMRRAEA